MIMAAAASAASAQNKLTLPQNSFPQQVLPIDTALKSPYLKDLIKPQLNNFKNLYDLKDLSPQTMGSVKNLSAVRSWYNMPVAVLQGNSKMQVKRLSGLSKMPVIGTDQKNNNQQEEVVVVP